jgi:hypothetical protein
MTYPASLSSIPAAVRTNGPWSKRAALCGVLAAGVVLASAAQAYADPISLNFKRTNIGSFVGSGRSNISQDYENANGWGVTFLMPEIPVFPLSYNPSTTGEQLYYNFFNVLNRSFSSTNGWNITGSLAGLSNNSLQVTTYSALGSAQRVGASFAVTYVPGQGDPIANIHWIQVVSDNNAITYPGGVATPNPGTLENKVDLARNNTTTPYYDTGTPVVATSRMFLDTSSAVRSSSTIPGSRRCFWQADPTRPEPR